MTWYLSLWFQESKDRSEGPLSTVFHVLAADNLISLTPKRRLLMLMMDWKEWRRIFLDFFSWRISDLSILFLLTSEANPLSLFPPFLLTILHTVYYFSCFYQAHARKFVSLYSDHHHHHVRFLIILLPTWWASHKQSVNWNTFHPHFLSSKWDLQSLSALSLSLTSLFAICKDSNSRPCSLSSSNPHHKHPPPGSLYHTILNLILASWQSSRNPSLCTLWHLQIFSEPVNPTFFSGFD